MSMNSDFIMHDITFKDEREIQNNKNGNDSSSSSDNSKEIKIKNKINGDVSGNNSMINGYDFDISHDEDYYDFGSEYLELFQDYGECIIGENSEDEEDKYVNYKNKNRNDIINCFKFLNEKEPEFEIDLNKGLTQMVEKNIEKMRNLPFYVNNEIIEV